MFVFPEQKQFSVGGIRFGGQVSNPCVLIGTIFYKKEGIFKGSGEFDRKRAEDLIVSQEALSDEFGIQCMVDVYAGDAEAMRDRIDFVAGVSERPFFIDSTDASVRLAGLAHAEEVGLIDRLVYNSINVGTCVDELDAISESSLSSAILLAFNPLANSIEGKIGVLEQGGGNLSSGLLDVASDCGITRPLVDTGITPLGEGAASAVRALCLVKSKYGLPSGCGIHNAVLAWRKLAGDDKLFADAASNAMVRLLGADFILYGPIERARKVFSTVSFAECLLGEMSEDVGFNVGVDHPYSVLLK